VEASEDEPLLAGFADESILVEVSDCWLCAFQMAAAKKPTHHIAIDVNLIHRLL
jgi:hypothetical protein